MGRTSNKGRYITKVGHLDIRATDTHDKGGKRSKVTGTDLSIHHSKKTLERGLKSIEEATEKCKEIMGKKYCETYNL